MNLNHYPLSINGKNTATLGNCPRGPHKTNQLITCFSWIANKALTFYRIERGQIKEGRARQKKKQARYM